MNITTLDKFYVHYYQAEHNQQSMEYHGTDCPRVRKFKRLPSAQ